MSKPWGTKGHGSIRMLAIDAAAVALTVDGELEVTGAGFVSCEETEEKCTEVEKASANQGWKLGKYPLQSSLKEETTKGSRSGTVELNQSWTASMSQASAGGLGKVVK